MRILRRRLTIALAALALLGVSGILVLDTDGQGRVKDAHPVLHWSRPGTKPLSDARAAALVTRTSESVPANTPANRRVPSRTELAAFRSARTDDGRTSVQFNPLLRYVTGRSGLKRPSTDELIQWVSQKWGIPTNLVRAQIVVESHWRQGFRGDRERVPQAWFSRYPPHARIGGSSEVFQSLGIPQVKWTPDGKIGAGTEPLRWQSTAFSLDYYAATVRYYYDGRCVWCNPGYGAGQSWNSVGGWFSPDPWSNGSADDYIREVQRTLSERSWTRLGR